MFLSRVSGLLFRVTWDSLTATRDVAVERNRITGVAVGINYAAYKGLSLHHHSTGVSGQNEALDEVTRSCAQPQNTGK